MKTTKTKSEIEIENFLFCFYLPLDLWIYKYTEKYNDKRLGIDLLTICDFLIEELVFTPKSTRTFLFMLKKIEKEVTANEN
jgi:hypothetical protein